MLIRTTGLKSTNLLHMFHILTRPLRPVALASLSHRTITMSQSTPEFVSFVVISSSGICHVVFIE